MVFKKMGLTIVLASVVLVSGLFIYRQVSRIDYNTTAYESELIKYFGEVALQSEFNEKVNRIVKWKKPMFLYIMKDKPYKLQIIAIQKAVNSINELTTPNFKVELTDNIDKSNAQLYLGSKEMVAKMAPNFYKSFTDDIDIDISGFGYIEFSWNSYAIHKVSIYIDPQDSIDVQEATILEEITQSIGLPFDPESHPHSIFYEHKSRDNINTKEYSGLDKDLIKLLYHPKMKPGSNSKQVERTIKRILKNKEIELSGG